jgi:hypothetical protein
MPPPHPPVQQQWAPPVGYFDPYFASMQESLSSQIAGLTSQMQSQMNLNFQNMQQQMFQPMMAQMQGVQESLHSDIAALDARFEDLPSFEQFEQLEHRQQHLEQSLIPSAQPSPGFLTTSTQCSRLQCRLQSSTRTSRSTHHHPSTVDGLIFLEIDAKGGEGALECFDLGGAHGLLMELIRFWLPLATHILFVLNSITLHRFMLYILHGFGL